MIIDDCYLLLLLDTCWETPDVLRPNTDRDPTMMVMLVLSKIMLILPHESGQGRSALQPCPDGRLVWSFVHRVAAQAGTLARPGAQRIAALAGRPVRPGVQRATALPGRLVRPGAQGATAGLKIIWSVEPREAFLLGERRRAVARSLQQLDGSSAGS